MGTQDKIMPVIDLERCTGCGDCVTACPEGALELIDGKPVLLNADACLYEGVCEDMCPEGAIGRPFVVVFDA